VLKNIDRKKKIAIVGAGNAASATALCLYRHASDLIDSITIYYDPSIPIEKVGQGTTLDFPDYIFTVLGINWHENDNLIKATYKSGILYENWGNKKEKIFHPFPLDTTGIHFVPHLLSKVILECGLFNVVEKNIVDPEKEIDADYIFDCRGKNNRNPELYDKLINPLNHVIVGKKLKPDLKLNYTRTVATPDGWTFVIPNQDSVSYGYLFNDNITNFEEASNNFFNMFNVDLDFDFKFENYIAKNCFCGEKTILNGNRLCFLEPLEASSMTYYLSVVRICLDYIFNNKSKEQCNTEIRNEMYKIQNFILWHYQYGSKYDTTFWKYAKSLKFEPDCQFKFALDYAKNNTFFDCITKSKGFSQWGSASIKNWIDGVEYD
jgi:tryptophan halogenase